MSLISVLEVVYQAGTKPLFSGLSLAIDSGDRVGLVGHNGSGKSTLLKIMAGEIVADAGRMVRARGLKVGMVEQFLPATVEVLAAREAILQCLPEDQRITEAYRVDTLLEELGFDDATANRPLVQMSGGQKNLVLFARAIIAEPEFLLLDEPGNHMDSLAMGQLKHYLQRADVPAFLMISHDRALLDAVTDRTLWLRDLRCYSLAMPYSQARAALSEQDEAARRTRAAEDKEIDKLRESAKRIAGWSRIHDSESLARKAKSMEKRVERMETEVTFVSEGSGLSLKVDAGLMQAKQIFTLDHTRIVAPGGRPLFDAEELTFRPGDRIALLGINGCGKSSMIRVLLAASAQAAGEQREIRFNPNVRLGYFDQELALFETAFGIHDWVREQTSKSTEMITRALVHWGFPYSARDRAVNLLSGGERARLVLLTFQLNQPNFLIMDEPTNHVDLQGKEELETDLCQTGISLLFTSHDQRFIETVATRFWWIRQGRLTEVHDAKDYFASMEKIGEPNSGLVAERSRVPDRTQPENEERLLQRIYQLEQLLAADRNRVKKFQKARLQQAWESELQLLLNRLG